MIKYTGTAYYYLNIENVQRDKFRQNPTCDENFRDELFSLMKIFETKFLGKPFADDLRLVARQFT